jgi:hypothetical protein
MIEVRNDRFLRGDVAAFVEPPFLATSNQVLLSPFDRITDCLSPMVLSRGQGIGDR